MDDLGPVPRRAPLTYPGRPLGRPALVELGGGRAPRTWRLEIRAGQPLGSARTPDGTLAEVLAAHGHAGLGERTPVLAIGSNACLAQMAHKAALDPERSAYPQVEASVTGLEVAYAAIVAGYGAVPATAVRIPGALATMAVQFLDADRVQRVDATELGYERVTLRQADGVTVTLPTGETLDAVDVYVAHAGVLADGDGPLLLGEGEGRRDQRAIQAHLLSFTGVTEDIDALARRLVLLPRDPAQSADGERLAALLREAISASGLAERNDLLPA